MHIPEKLIPLLWCTAGIGLFALVALSVGITLLLGTVEHRKVALPMVWISASALVTAATVLVLLLTHW
jgi:ABC-type Co2+ transport system permease subunit